MSLTRIFQEKVPRIFKFIKDDYVFDFEIIDEFRMMLREEDINLYIIFDGEILY
jgi:hypothetical protein